MADTILDRLFDFFPFGTGLVIIAVLIAALGCLIIGKKEISNRAIYVSLIVVISILVAVFGVIMLEGYEHSEASRVYYYQTTNTSIASLSDGQASGGNFFLGCGQIKDQTYYYFYQGTTSFQLKKIRTDGATIFMDENDQPYLSTMVPVYNTLARDGRVDTYPDYSNDTLYELHVPENTIKKGFNLDGVV